MERAITPGLEPSQHRYYAVVREHVRNADWLDLGCGHCVFGNWMLEQQKEVIEDCRSIVGADLDLEGLKKHQGIRDKCMASGYALPFRNQAFDLITANMVVEHIGDPGALFHEVSRVLRPGGRFIFHTPNRSGYSTIAARCLPEFSKKPLARIIDGREADDVFPTHYRMNSAAEIMGYASSVGLKAAVELVCSSALTGSFAPAAFFELLLLRLLRRKSLESYRPEIIAVVTKPAVTQ